MDTRWLLQRTAILISVIGLLSSVGCAINSNQNSENTGPIISNPEASKPEEVAEWMNTWISLKKAPGGSLHLLRFADPVYILTKDISWVPNPGQEQYGKVTVPKGFVTDFASIPRIFWSALRPDGNYTYAAIVHDYLYWNQTKTREESNEIFRFAMKDFDIPDTSIFAIYQAVQIFGGGPWRENASEKESGERRILKLFPTDPLTRWDEWKTKDEVFH